MHKCITTRIDSSLSDPFTASWSPSHIDFCHFKVTVLAPLQWGHQTLSSFGFPTYPHSSCMCSPPSMWPNSNNTAAFDLELLIIFFINLVFFLLDINLFFYWILMLCSPIFNFRVQWIFSTTRIFSILNSKIDQMFLLNVLWYEP
jgi:hypothetical protein